MELKTINGYLLVEESNNDDDEKVLKDPIFQLKKKGMSGKEFVTVIVTSETDNDKGIYKNDKLLVESHLLRKFDEKTYVVPMNAVIAIFNR